MDKPDDAGPAAERTARMKRAAEKIEQPPIPDQKRPRQKIGEVKKTPLPEEKVAKKD